METSARKVKRRAPSKSPSEPFDPLFDTSPSSTSASSSSRVTRSSARLAAAESVAQAQGQPPLASTSQPPPAAPPTRKRKSRAAPESASDNTPEPVSPVRRGSKRQKVAPPGIPAVPTPPATLSRQKKAKPPPVMSNTGTSSGPSNENANPVTATATSSKRKSNRSKKPVQAPTNATPASSTRRAKKGGAKRDGDVSVKGLEDKAEASVPSKGEETLKEEPGDDDSEDGAPHYNDIAEDEDDDPFGASLLGRPGCPPAGFSSTLRALSGMMSGVTSRLRDIQNNLKQKDDPSIQLIALQELSEMLLVSTEDNLSGHFSPDQLVKELVTLMQPSEFGEENPEMMLLACRCIANLMEALPASTSSVVYGGAVPVLCQKLLEIHFIDLAEQALSTLEKVSADFPASIVREGGLTACLTYLDFFATSTQRTAVTTAANCCRNIPEDSFPVIRDVMPILLNVLSSSDQKVVEQGCLCVSRIAESFKYHQDKLEELFSTDLLRAILRLLLPGTTNLIGPSIHTQFLRVLAIIAHASPTLSVELFKMNIVDTLYQILTGVSPPSGLDEDVASQIDSVLIMQAIIHRPREQVLETLNVIGELLPGIPRDSLAFLDEVFKAGYLEGGSVSSPRPRKSPAGNRAQLLQGCREELKRFAVILLPTLTDAYSSTVNVNVRQKVLTAQLKMLSNLDTDMLEVALRPVPYASFLASILSQKDHVTLVASALQAAELLLRRLEPIYRYQFYREGVIAEIAKLAESPMKKADEPVKEIEVPKYVKLPTSFATKATKSPPEPVPVKSDASHDNDDFSDDDNDDDEDRDDMQDDMSASPSSSSSSERNYSFAPGGSSSEDSVVLHAKKIIEVYENNKGKSMRDKANMILEDLQTLAREIETCYVGGDDASGVKLFRRLAKYFDGDALESITSAELLNSEIVRVLLEIFSNSDEQMSTAARADFLKVFMGTTVQGKLKTTSSKSPTTSFSVLVHKLHDLLSRSEHFEVITVHQNSYDSSRSSGASMLAKQLRLKLVADDSDIPRPFKEMTVSIHAIATFKALDDYLRPRISLSERPRGARHREGITNALAAFAAVAGLPTSHQRLADRGLTAETSSVPAPLPPSNMFSGRHPKKAPKAKTPTTTPAAQSSSSTPQQKPTAPRRSSRKNPPQSQPAPPPPPPAFEPTQSPLECADERQLTDEDDLDDAAALDAIVDDLEDKMDEHVTLDPTAVNMEVAPTGKVTARKEDGTRVGTPSNQPGSSSRQPDANPSNPGRVSLATPTASSRLMSYAQAIQATPQDWHIEFSIGDRPISNETTIYRAVHNNQIQPEETSLRNVWSAVHTIKYKRAPGPPPPEPSSLTPPPESAQETAASGLPLSLDKNPTTSAILRLLNILHALNANLDDVLTENKETLKLNLEPLAQFVNTKLTAKLNRQLEEPLIVASNCIPSWSEDLARLYPFLFPFETRHLFLQSTSFGYSRSMSRWQSTQTTTDARQDRRRDDRPFLGRLQRQKVRISRTRILESAVKVMELYGASPSVLEVEYFEEVGTGLGPTLEFYSNVSKEFSKRKLKLWRENESEGTDEFAFGKRGLFPAPMSEEQANTENGKKVLHLFKMLGKFVARSMLDSRIIDVSFNPTFFRVDDSDSTIIPSLGSVKAVDEGLAKSLQLVKQFAVAKKKIDEDTTLGAAQKVYAASRINFHGAHIEDLGLDFTLPGYPSIELSPDGANTAVTIDNVDEYLKQVIDLTLGSGVRRQVTAFRTGFSQVFPYGALKAFTPDELVMLFGRVEEDWSLETLLDSIKADHGFNVDSKSVRNLLQIMSEMSLPKRRDFLQFVTGSPKLPIGGFKSLTPMFTVVCKPSEPPYTSDDFLPSVMTCVNYLKLPDYTNLEFMRERLDVAIQEGQGAFHLS